MATTDTKDEDFLSRKRVRSANLSQLTKLYNELERNMCSFDNNDYVRSLYNKLVEHFDQFKSAHLQCLDLYTETDVANILIEHFDNCQKNFVELQERYTQWVTAGQRPTPEDEIVRMPVALHVRRLRRVRRFRRKTDYGMQEQSVL